MDLSIIIVNWNSKDYLQACLNSIASNTSVEHEVIVIDAASYDGSGEMLRRHHPEVRFIQHDRNVGFARANNIAFGQSSGEYVVFLNPDTEILGPSLDIMYRYLHSMPAAGIMGAKLLNSDRTVQDSCIQAFPTILNQMLDCNGLRRQFPRSRLWGIAPLWAKSQSCSEVDTVSGACLMIKRSVFERVNMFSTEYFMYSEDIDLCAKVRTLGFRTYFAPTAHIIHHVGASTAANGVNTFSDVMIMESRWRYFRKTRNSYYASLYRFAMLSVSIVRLIILSVLKTLRGERADIRNAMTKWTARLRWTIGRETWVRNFELEPSATKAVN